MLTTDDVDGRLAGAFHLLGATGAFLPDRVLPTRLPPPFDAHTAAAVELADRFPVRRGGVRPWLDATFGRADPDLVAAVHGLDELGRHKLLSTLTALAHAYRWHTVPPDPARFAEWRIALPAAIAGPLAAVAADLEHPQVGTTWSLHLCNWWSVDHAAGSSYDPAALGRTGLHIAFPWLGPPHDADLEAFSLTFVLVEARGARVLSALRHALGAAGRDDVHGTAYALDQLAGAIAGMAEPFIQLIRDAHVDRRVWLPLVQPPFAWAAETAPGEEARLATPGPSGMQTGVIQALDAALGIGADSFVARSARDGRRFMLARHRRFLETLDELGPVLRGFVLRSRDPRLATLFNECVQGLRTFRVVHAKRGATYLAVGRERSGPRVSTGLAVRWTDDASASAQSTALESDDHPVETFTRVMTERIAETSASALPVLGRWDVPTPLGLAKEDLDRILAVATTRRVAAGTDVIRPDERRQALYFIRSGTVRIAPPGRGLSAGRLGAGEVFGEVAFLLNAGAPAGVVAEEDTDVDVVTRQDLHHILDADAALAARFFAALAVLEAERLRLVVRRAGDTRPSDLPTTADPRLDQCGTPAAATAAVLTALEDAARSGFDPGLQRACDGVVDHLAGLRPGEVAEAGRHVLRAGFPILGRSRLLRLAMLGPGRLRRDNRALAHGTAGDPAGDDHVGELVDRWALTLPSFAALRARSAAIRRARAAAGEIRRVLCVETCAVGDVVESLARDAELTVIDTNPEELAVPITVSGGSVRAVRENVLHLANGLGRVPLQAQDLVVCLDFFAHLPDREAVPVVDWAHAHLRPGGVLLLGCPAAAARDEAFLEHVAGWAYHRRSAEQLSHLFTRSEFLTSPVTTWTDEDGGAVFAFAHR